MGSGVSVDDKIHFVAPETTLAVIDARLGKRRIKVLADNIEKLLRREFWEKAHEDRELCHGLFGDEDNDNRIRAMRHAESFQNDPVIWYNA